MRTIETERLILRKFTIEDFDAVQSYASCVENIVYMLWGPNSAEQTREFIEMAISQADEEPCKNYQYAAVLRSSGKLIGACNLALSGGEPEIGWILHRDYWKQGYGTEMGEAMLRFGFGELGLHRILAHCDAENTGSYKLMEKIGMRREGLFIEGRPAHKLSEKKYGDELSYAILREEWDIKNEIVYYNSLPVEFSGFIDLPELSDGVIHLVCSSKGEANPEKKWVPAYNLIVCKGSERVGYISLRLGYTDSLYYGGQIGYGTDEKYRGNGYAARACRLLLPVAKAHGMTKLLITNNQTNEASKRVCEKLGARFVRVARIPEWHDLYKEGGRFSNIFEWNVE